VAIASNVVSASAGVSFSLYLTANGSLWAMGYNGYGQLGDGDTANLSVPFLVATNVVTLAAGEDHSLYVKADGTLWGMGWNGDGEFGNGTNIQSLVPTQITNHVLGVVAGTWHSVILKANGAVSPTGQNQDGQLGTGTTTGSYAPITVATNAVAVTAGYEYSEYLLANGALFAMGDNNLGQLGVGTLNESNSPVPVDGGGLLTATLARGPLSSHSLAMALAYPVLGPLTNLTVNYLSPFGFTAVVTGGDGPFSYQWQLNGVNIPGATNAAYSAASAQLSQQGEYTVVATGPAGSVSASASLTVLINLPKISLAPTNIFQPVGQPASLSVTATGTAPLTYQWLKDGMMLPGQTNTTLAFSSIQYADYGSYQVSVANPGGVAVSLPVLVSGTNASLRTWCYGAAGQLGNSLPTTIPQAGYYITTPNFVTNSVVAVAVGGISSTFYIRADASLWGMGEDIAAQPGGAGLVTTNRPYLIANNVLSVVSGNNFYFYITTNGTLWGADNNQYGQLGIGSTTNLTAGNFAVQVATNVVAVAVGMEHALFLKADGTLWSMGNNFYGQLGVGSTTASDVPLLMASNVVSMSAGDYHSLFVQTDGSLWGAGYNVDGELGNNLALSNTVPILIATNVVGASAGAYHSLFVKSDQSLWAMGNSIYGQCGTGAFTTNYTPAQVATNVTGIAAGQDFSLFQTAGGGFWGMGQNELQQLLVTTPNTVYGDDTNLPCRIDNGAMVVASLARFSFIQLLNDSEDAFAAIVGYLPQINAASLANQTIDAGQSFSFTPSVTAGDGPFTYQWQFNGVNLPGATNLTYTATNATLASAGTYTLVVAGSAGSTSASAVLTVVIGPPVFTSQPTNTVGAPGQPVTVSANVSGTGPFGYQWLKDGVVLAAQTNSALTFASFQLINSGTYQVVVTNAGGIQISRPVFVSITNALLLGWGYNNDYSLGLGNPYSTNLPVTLATNVVAESAGYSQSLFVKADGTLWGMGENTDGQLSSNAPPTTATTPVLLVTNVVTAAAGEGNSWYVTSDGSLWSLGANGYGELGTGSTVASTNVPVKVTTNVVTVVAGGAHALFIKADGTLWSMGYNDYGQLGNGSTNNASTPFLVASNVITAAAGSIHSLYLKADGNLWAMGNNGYGQLGGAISITNELPFVLATNVIAVAAGNWDTLYVQANGNLWTLGYDSDGQLGNGSTGNKVSVPFLAATNVMAVAGGDQHSLYETADGVVWSMGDNANGQLGIGSGVNSTVPVQVHLGGWVGASLGRASESDHSLAVAGQGLFLNPLGNQTVSFGQPFSFTVVVASGVGPFGYQWQLNGTNLPAATNATYSVASATLGEAGIYSVVVTNAYASSASASATLTVNPLAASVQLGSLSQTYDGTAKSASYTTTPTGLTATLTYNGSSAPPTNAGSYTVIGQITSAGYAGLATNTLVIAKAAQTINFGPVYDVVIGDPPRTLTATASSGLPVSYVSSVPAVASVSGSTLTILTVGGTTLTASQAGNANYLAATNVSQPVVVQAVVMVLGIQPGPETNNQITTAILSVTGNSNRVYTIIYNDNLLLTNWPVLLTTNLPAPTYYVTVPATNWPARFYRLERVITPP
jgi:alpha-tubulin suppressor-like RCC1 family protein